MDEGQDPGAVGCQIFTASLRPPPGVILPAVTHQAPVIIKFLQCFGKWGNKGVQSQEYWSGVDFRQYISKISDVQELIHI